MHTIDSTQFFTQALATARRNLPYSQDARQAAREALQEAHSALSQPDFFAALDALGGHDTVLQNLVDALQD